MRERLSLKAPWAWLAFSLVWLVLGPYRVPAADTKMKLEVQLIWATNDRQSPDPTHKPVDAEILKGLGLGGGEKLQ